MERKLSAWIAVAAAALLFVACLDDDSSGASSSSPALEITSSMRASCPDTTGLGLEKQTFQAYQMSCLFEWFDYDGYAIASSTSCSESSIPEAIQSQGASGTGYYFIRSTITLDGVQDVSTRCIFYVGS